MSGAEGLGSPRLEELERLLEGSVDAAVIVDEQHQIRYRNPAYDAYTGRRPREVQSLVSEGAPCHALFNLEICAEDCMLRRAGRAGKAVRIHEIAARRGDGTSVTLIVTTAPLGGGLYVETYRDVTAESRMQRTYHALLSRERDAKEELERTVEERTAELRRAQDQLLVNEKLSSLGRLVAGIAHELNNPIHFVYGNVDFLVAYFRQLLGLVAVYEEGPLEDVRARAAAYKASIDYAYLEQDWRRLSRSLRAGAERAAHIVAGLKTFSQPRDGALVSTDLLEGLETSLQLLRPILRDGVTVHRRFEPLPPIRCRPVQVQQVFVNVLTNAVQAMGPGGGEVFLEVTSKDDGVQVRVRDTGPGIPQGLRDKIFDPFFTTKEVGEGTGLGLAISQRIVRSHGGSMQLSPERPEGGAEFVVWLPRDPPTNPET